MWNPNYFNANYWNEDYWIEGEAEGDIGIVDVAGNLIILLM